MTGGRAIACALMVLAQNLGQQPESEGGKTLAAIWIIGWTLATIYHLRGSAGNRGDGVL